MESWIRTATVIKVLTTMEYSPNAYFPIMRATTILTAKMLPWLKTVAIKFHIVPLVNRRRRLTVSPFLSLNFSKRNTNSVVLQQNACDERSTF